MPQRHAQRLGKTYYLSKRLLPQRQTLPLEQLRLMTAIK
jgi:hypothetical protein